MRKIPKRRPGIPTTVAYTDTSNTTTASVRLVRPSGRPCSPGTSGCRRSSIDRHVRAADHKNAQDYRAWVISDKVGKTAPRTGIGRLGRADEGGCLLHPTAEEKPRRAPREPLARTEYAAELPHLRRGEERVEDQQDTNREDLPHGDRKYDHAGVPATAVRRGNLTQRRGHRPVFTSVGDAWTIRATLSMIGPTSPAGRTSEQRRPAACPPSLARQRSPERVCGRTDSDPAEEDAADRAHDEPHGENNGRTAAAPTSCPRRGKSAGEVDGEHTVGRSSRNTRDRSDRYGGNRRRRWDGVKARAISVCCLSGTAMTDLQPVSNSACLSRHCRDRE